MKNFKSKWGALIILLVLSVGIVAIFYFDNESNSKNYSDNKKTQNNGDKIIQNYTISYLNEKITDRFNEMSHVVTLYNDIKLEEDNNKEDELIVSVNYISPKNYSIEEIGKLTITNLNNIKKDWTFDKYISKYIINYYSSGISKYTIEHENNSMTNVDKIILKNNITNEELEIDNTNSNSNSITTDKNQVDITNDSSSSNSSIQNNTNNNSVNNNNNNNNSSTTYGNKRGLGDTFIFDGLILTFDSDYSFTTIENRYSDYNGNPVIKLGVNVKNASSQKNSLNMFFYNLFGSKGIELDSITAYFDDSIDFAGDLKPGASYKSYFYILYDGDGKYSIDFDNYSQEISVEFNITK